MSNFDTLIERALREEGVAFECYAGPADYQRDDHVGIPVYKIHGSAGADSTLIDTVGQKLRGIPPYVRSALTSLFEQHPVVVLVEVDAVDWANLDARLILRVDARR